MDDSYDILEDPRPGSPFARGLSLLLGVAMAVLSLVFIGFLIFGVSMFFPNGLQDMVFSELSESQNVPAPQKFGLIFLAASLMTAAYIFVINVLRKIVATLVAGDPFVPANISRLRTVWIVLAAFEIIRMLTSAFLAVDINAMSVSDVQTGTIDIRLGTWFLVFVIAALAEVFRHGAMLRRDQEFTI